MAAAMDGQGFIVSAGNDATVRCWNVVKGTLVRELHGHKAWVQAVSLLDTGRLLSASMDTTASPTASEPCSPLAMLSRSFRLLAAHSLSLCPLSQFRVWSPPWQRNTAVASSAQQHPRCESVVRGYGGNPETIVAFPEASLVVASASDGTVRVQQNVSFCSGVSHIACT